MIWRHAEIVDIPAILAAMVIIGVLGFIINDIFVMAERRFFKYRFLVPAM
jgi:ABC-type nitrate/sulfonate/bicarbonate transport system permease component